MDIKIGFQLVPWFGEFKRMREQWMEAEALGVDALYTGDHFFPQNMDPKAADSKGRRPLAVGQNFEATSIQAAMAATTSRVEIGCFVHAIGYRNPNLLADIARTIDHISNGRFILGVGAGYEEVEYLEYGYTNFGTMKSRLEDLASGLVTIRDRLGKLNPPPVRKLPILIASMGERYGMRIVAQHADKWHLYGSIEQLKDRIEKMKNFCQEIGRDFSEIEMQTWYSPDVLSQGNVLDEYLKLGIRNIAVPALGPDWDLRILRDLLAWRKSMT